MKTKLLLSLEEAIGKWVDKESAGPDWIDAYWPENGVELVTVAAASVVDAFDAERKYIRENDVT